MEDRLKGDAFYCDNMITVKEDAECTIYKMKDGSGEGTMTCYKVFPGIDLIYNDFHMQNCLSKFQPKVEMLGIDHCKEGRIEWQFKNGSYLYLEEGDFQINLKESHDIGFGFPLSHYHGITIAVYIDKATNSLSKAFGEFSIDVKKLCEKFCSNNKTFIMRADKSIEHIFSELYTVPDTIRNNYFKIKVLELLLFLSALDESEDSEERVYFPKRQVEKVKLIMKYITKNLDKHFTLDELSTIFEMSLTSLKLCFKGVYGKSVYAYIRSYRIHTAAIMLKETNANITDIAGRVGYANPSKFSAAFKKIMGMAPSKYRKQVV
ncbi:helix-turn-helix domain-containing protein [Sporosalibacterium faouarense]|uniref:helix-turn-helix domain-containing protein n=1 Tax=Sporosalibacterium faouarense TaxID=516123 RepID=UPI00141C134E|nr:AraC family transcriptional regulator [Sporosalibacterium faouarense]MTI47144.1 helix-turn-helix transcriptional regulator [Bacillota bacterium]